MRNESPNPGRASQAAVASRCLLSGPNTPGKRLLIATAPRLEFPASYRKQRNITNPNSNKNRVSSAAALPQTSAPETEAPGIPTKINRKPELTAPHVSHSKQRPITQISRRIFGTRLPSKLAFLLIRSPNLSLQCHSLASSSDSDYIVGLFFNAELHQCNAAKSTILIYGTGIKKRCISHRISNITFSDIR